MKLTIDELNDLVGGTLHGDGNITITNARSLETAGDGDVAFASEKNLAKAADSNAAVLLLPQAVEDLGKPCIVVDDPELAFNKILEILAGERNYHPEGIDPHAIIASDANLGDGVAVGPNAIIGPRTEIGARSTIHANVIIGPDCQLGEDCIIYSNAVIRERVVMGDRVTIHNCTTIGGDGFGYLRRGEKHIKVPQVGTVLIGNDVEIGCNCTIDRATMDETVIGNMVKIDNHSHIAHNCRIGDNCILVAYARMGGGVVLGKNVILAEDVGITDHVTIGDGAIIGGSSKVSKSIAPGAIVWGMPAQPIQKEKRQIAALRKLADLFPTIRELKREVKALKERAGT